MLRKYSLILCLLTQAAWASPSLAAPASVTVTYQATRNGQPFANIKETFTQAAGKYRIESVAEGIGVYALFGKRIQLSEGEVTADGLKPHHFELHQGDNEKRALYADFDWQANTLNMKVKGKPVTASLEKGAQDLLSFAYQFMYSQPKGADFYLPVTTGKKLRNYHYRVADRDLAMETPAGKFKTIHLTDADKDADDNKELWLGAESHFLPVRLDMTDDNGAKIEQTLTSVHAE